MRPDIPGPYELALGVRTQPQANRALHRLVLLDMQKYDSTPAIAERRVRYTLGWHAFRLGHAEWARIERLYGAVHPVFGRILEEGPPSEVLAQCLMRTSLTVLRAAGHDDPLPAQKVVFAKSLAARAIQGTLLISVS